MKVVTVLLVIWANSSDEVTRYSEKFSYRASCEVMIAEQKQFVEKMIADGVFKWAKYSCTTTTEVSI